MSDYVEKHLMPAHYQGFINSLHIHLTENIQFLFYYLYMYVAEEKKKCEKRHDGNDDSETSNMDEFNENYE